MWIELKGGTLADIRASHRVLSGVEQYKSGPDNKRVPETGAKQVAIAQVPDDLDDDGNRIETLVGNEKEIPAEQAKGQMASISAQNKALAGIAAPPTPDELREAKRAAIDAAISVADLQAALLMDGSL
jgi:hypothetical protein